MLLQAHDGPHTPSSLEARNRAFPPCPQGEPTPWTPWVWTSSLGNCQTKNCGTLSWLSSETNTVSSHSSSLSLQVILSNIPWSSRSASIFYQSSTQIEICDFYWLACLLVCGHHHALGAWGLPRPDSSSQRVRGLTALNERGWECPGVEPVPRRRYQERTSTVMHIWDTEEMKFFQEVREFKNTLSFLFYDTLLSSWLANFQTSGSLGKKRTHWMSKTTFRSCEWGACREIVKAVRKKFFKYAHAVNHMVCWIYVTHLKFISFKIFWYSKLLQQFF